MTTPFDAFGPGIVIVTRTDVAVPTPVNIGFAQGINFDFSASIKELIGQNQFALDAARGAVKVSGKMNAAVLSGLAWNTIFFGESMATGGIKWNPNEAGTIPGSTAYTVTVANSVTFDQDLGVVYADTNLPFTRVVSGPTIGQYSVAAGVYTFAAADASKAVLITYSSTQTGGQTLAINNHLLGYSPTFQLDYYTSRNNKALVARFFQCQASKVGLAAKLEDFLMPEFDFSIFANSAGNVAKLYFPEIS
jgi:hypothetical protein